MVGILAVARTLTRYWHQRATSLRAEPRIVFMSNGHDGAANAYADMLRAAVEALIRVWRDETMEQLRGGRRQWVDWANQVVQWSNSGPDSLAFAATLSASLLHRRHRVTDVNLYLPASVAETS